MSFLFLRPVSSNRLISLALATLLPACVAEQEPTPQGAVADVGSSATQAAPDGGLLLPDAAVAFTAAPAAAEETSELTTLAEFRCTVDVAAGTMRLTVLDGDAVTDPALRRAQQGLCALTIVQDGVPGTGPADSMELVTGTTGLDAACDGYLASPLFCGAVTVRSFYATAQTQVFAQILALAPSTGFSVQNGDVVPGASSGIGSWAYGDLSAPASAPTNEGVRNWVFARSGGNFTFTGRLVANVPELCDGLDNDCDGLTDEGNGCRAQGQACTASSDCVSPLTCTAGLCAPTVCPSGEHFDGAACTSDTRTCTLSGGSGDQVWNGTGWDGCIASACSIGFVLYDGSCPAVGCGNGVTEGSEGCDDGNLVDTDFCTATCTPAACGDGILLDLYEECDDGNLLTEECIYGEASCVVCDDACALFAGETDFCGDGILDAAELCDDGNTADGDSCSSTCVCGVGFHLEGGACISDTRNCLPPPTGIATGTQTWSGTSWAICLAATCATGYHLEGGACPRNPVAYVVNEYLGTVSVIDTITQLVTTTIPVGVTPRWVTVNSSGTFAYVTNADSGSVSVIDTATNTVSATVAVGQNPSGVALSPTGSSAYVTNFGDSSLSVFNTTSNTVTGSVPVGYYAWRIAVNGAGSLAYVAMLTSPTLLVIDTATNTVTTTIPIGTSSGYQSGAVGIALNGAGTLAYALLPAEMSTTSMQSRVKVIDTATNTVTATIPVGGMANSEEGSLTVNAAGTRLYVATWESNSVSVIDTATNTVIAEIAVGISPTALSMGATDALLYVTNREDDAVKVIDTATNTVTATIPVGIHPVAIAVASPPAPLGALCALNGQCASGFCATGPDGNANDRCAPLGMNYLPPTTFVMGSPLGEVGRSTIEEQHTVTISRGLYIGQTEVIQAQWKALSGGINPSYFQSTTGTEQSTANANDSGPVEQIDWYSAAAFANAKSAADGLTACYILINCDDPIDGWKDGIHAGCNDAAFAGVPCTGYRLPTESESQYAARGGATTATFGGDLSGDTACVTVSGEGSVLPGTPLSDLAWYACNAGGRTHQVAEKVANGFGLYDVLGNAWEWTGDWSGNYPASGVSDPTGPANGTGRVLTGCSVFGDAGLTRSATRGNFSGARAGDVGFRLVRTAF